MSETALIPKKRTRKGLPKSSRGCITCKIRHVRCDEQRPACSKCEKSGRQCDGYSPDGRRPDLDPLQIVYWQSSKFTVHQPSVDIPGNNKERRAFHFFREKSTGDFAGFFETSFWDRLVLQASHAEPSIRHAVVALGSLHENARQKESGSTCDQFALQQCNKAIGHLKQNSCSKGQQLSSEMLMMSCAIFVCFESLQGNYESALSHIQGGLRIFRDWQAEALASSPAGATNLPQHRQSVDNEIVQMFSRLNLQTIMFPDTRSLSPDFANQDIRLMIDPIPDTFTNLKEARDCLDDCMSYQFHASMVAYFNRQNSQSSSNSTPDQPQDPSNPQLFAQWSSAFFSFLSSQAGGGGSPTLPAKDLQVAQLLEIQYLCAQIFVSVGLPPEETAFDNALPSFEKIITLADSIINDNSNNSSPLARGRSSASIAAGNFTFETGLVAPLYLTATRCRNPWLRRQALSLLVAAPRQECIWNSEMLAKIAERLILIEEGRKSVGEVAREDGVGVTSRVSVLNATICSERRAVLVECCQRVYGDEDEEMSRLDEWIEY